MEQPGDNSTDNSTGAEDDEGHHRPPFRSDDGDADADLWSNCESTDEMLENGDDAKCTPDDDVEKEHDDAAASLKCNVDGAPKSPECVECKADGRPGLQRACI